MPRAPRVDVGGEIYQEGQRKVPDTIPPSSYKLAIHSMTKYGPKAQKKISKVMHEFGKGKLKSGTSVKKVTSQKQAVAIAISEARREGGKVPRQDRMIDKKRLLR